jgi:predicted RNA-binding protein associated with RNAse of E/G family
VPWSVWLFWDEDGTFEGWYVNLEAVHRREGRHLFSSDHVLDVWITADGEVRMKDEDELAAAVQQGLFSPEQGREIEGDARAAVEAFRAGAFPFDEPWAAWRPDPAWARPGLPVGARWTFDELAAG